MSYDLQKASLLKRAAALLLDLILIVVLATGIGMVLSAVLDYDSYNEALTQCQTVYEAKYQVSFDLSQADYLAMTEAQQQYLNDAYAEFAKDPVAIYNYNMVINLSLVILSLAVLIAYLALEFVVPLLFGNGQTLGKKIFGLCLIRQDGVQVNNLQLFARMILGKYTIEIMIPVCILLMIFWGVMGVSGTMILLALLAGQAICLIVTRNNAALHDLLAGTVVVDMASQTIFRSTEDLIAYQKRIAAERAARQPY